MVGVCDSGVNGGVNAGLMRFGGGGDAGRLSGVDGLREYSGSVREEMGLGANTGEGWDVRSGIM